MPRYATDDSRFANFVCFTKNIDGVRYNGRIDFGARKTLSSTKRYFVQQLYTAECIWKFAPSELCPVSLSAARIYEQIFIICLPFFLLPFCNTTVCFPFSCPRCIFTISHTCLCMFNYNNTHVRCTSLIRFTINLHIVHHKSK